jgi:hypothetical protein
VIDDRRLRIDLQLGDDRIAGAVTHDDGRIERFDGWLALIAIVQAAAVGSPSEEPAAPG